MVEPGWLNLVGWLVGLFVGFIVAVVVFAVAVAGAVAAAVAVAVLVVVFPQTFVLQRWDAGRKQTNFFPLVWKPLFLQRETGFETFVSRMFRNFFVFPSGNYPFPGRNLCFGSQTLTFKAFVFFLEQQNETNLFPRSFILCFPRPPPRHPGSGF